MKNLLKKLLFGFVFLFLTSGGAILANREVVQQKFYGIVRGPLSFYFTELEQLATEEPDLQIAGSLRGVTVQFIEKVLIIWNKLSDETIETFNLMFDDYLETVSREVVVLKSWKELKQELFVKGVSREVLCSIVFEDASLDSFLRSRIIGTLNLLDAMVSSIMGIEEEALQRDLSDLGQWFSHMTQAYYYHLDWLLRFFKLREYNSFFHPAQQPAGLHLACQQQAIGAFLLQLLQGAMGHQVAGADCCDSAGESACGTGCALDDE